MNTLKKMRIQKQWSQEQLARKLGVTQQAVARWESSDGMKKSALLLRIADIFGCTVDELLREDR